MLGTRHGETFDKTFIKSNSLKNKTKPRVDYLYIVTKLWTIAHKMTKVNMNKTIVVAKMKIVFHVESILICSIKL